VILAISLLAEDISAQVLFENVSIYNGKSSALSQPINVLIDGNLIKIIGSNSIPVSKDVTKILKMVTQDYAHLPQL